ncbi:MAG: hypothetical protein D6687_07130 [Acidobacteria bacterium]|nr:MAG: hypothetical protein D6687_07130 [Acidobacteriota bacterium]
MQPSLNLCQQKSRESHTLSNLHLSVLFASIFILMRKWIYQAHLILGLLASIPVLAWSLSGLLYVLPSSSEGSSKVEKIDTSKVKISPSEAIQKANELAGRTLPITALTLLMKDGVPHYQAIGGLGADSIFINAETGTAEFSKPPSLRTRFAREAHFYFFAGSWQKPLLITFSTLACLLALSGIYLNIVYWFNFVKSRIGSRTSN